jgi:ABC-type nitrate/sulfonate/bicarbonate transport system substrate-binding protein
MEMSGSKAKAGARRLGVLVVAAAMAGAALPLAGIAAEKLSVVTSSTGFLYVTTYIAKQKGYFADAGLDVTVYDGSGGSNAVAAIVGKSAQIGAVGVKNASQAVEKGVPLKIVGTGTRGFPLAVTVRRDLPGLDKLAKNAPLAARGALLRKHIVAVTDIGGSSGGFVRYLLAKAGVPDKDVTVININSPAGMLANLRAKKIDGFVESPPMGEMAGAAGYGFPLVVPNRDIPEIASMEYIVQVVREDYLKEHAAAVEGYLKGIRRAQQLAAAQPDEARKAFFDYMKAVGSGKGMKLDADVEKLMWDGNTSAIPDTVAISPKSMAATRAFFKVSDKVTDAVFVDNSIADRIMAGESRRPAAK